MAEPVDPQEFGEIKATVSGMKGSVDELRRDFKEMMEAVTNIQLTLAQAKGGWRMMIGIGGACATMGAAMWEVLRHFLK